MKLTSEQGEGAAENLKICWTHVKWGRQESGMRKEADLGSSYGEILMKKQPKYWKNTTKNYPFYHQLVKWAWVTYSASAQLGTELISILTSIPSIPFSKYRYNLDASILTLMSI